MHWHNSHRCCHNRYNGNDVWSHSQLTFINSSNVIILLSWFFLCSSLFSRLLSSSHMNCLIGLSDGLHIVVKRSVLVRDIHYTAYKFNHPMGPNRKNTDGHFHFNSFIYHCFTQRSRHKSCFNAMYYIWVICSPCMSETALVKLLQVACDAGCFLIDGSVIQWSSIQGSS